MKEGNEFANANVEELYKKHRLSLDNEIKSLDFSGMRDEDFESFAGSITERLGIDADAVIGSKGYVLNDSAVKLISVKGGYLDQAKMHMEKAFAGIIEKHVGRRLLIKTENGEKKKVAIVFANMNAPLVSQTEVNVGEGSELQLFEVFVSKSTRSSLNLSAHNVEVRKGGALEMDVLHNEDGYTTAAHFGEFVLREHAGAKINIVYEGGKSAVAENTVEAAGYGSHSELNSTLISSGEQRFDIMDMLVNAVAGTSCLGETKSILMDKSLNFVKDMAVIAPKSIGSRSYIKERAILLGKDARASLLPDMSISENDVKASHSAAAAPIDKEAIFYLMAKGMNERDATNLVATGFIDDIIGRVSDGSAKAIIMSHVNEKLKSGRFGELLENNLRGIWEERPGAAPSLFEGGAKYSKESLN